MKYHATLSTIVISIIVLLIFSSVAVFTVFSLNILSPGYMISDYLLAKIPILDPYELSYEQITSLNNGVTIKNVDVALEKQHFMHIDSVRISASIFDLIKSYLNHKMDFDIKLLGVDIDVPFEYTNFVLPNIFVNSDTVKTDVVDTKTSKLEVNFKIAADGAKIKYLQLFDLSGLTFNLDLNSDYSVSTLKLQLESGIVSYNSIDINASDFRLDYESGKETDIILSVEDLTATEEFDLQLSALRFSTTIKDLKNIDYYSLPLNISIGDLNFNYIDSSLKAKGLSLTYSDNEASIFSEHVNGNYNEFSLYFDKLPVFIQLDENSLNFNFDSNNQFIFGYKNRDLFSIRSLRAELNKNNDEYLLMLNKLDIASVNLNESIKYFESANINNVNVVAKYSKEKGTEVAGSIDVSINTEFESLKNIYLPLSISTSFDKDFKVKEASVYSSNPKIFEGEEGLKVNFDLNNYNSFSFSMNKGSDLKINGSLSDILSLKLEANNYNLSLYNELIETFVPALQSYIGEGTSLTSVINLNYDRKTKEGNLDSLLTISDIRFNQFEFSLSTTLDSHISDSVYDINRLVLASSFFRAEYRGLIDFETFKPDGVFTLSLPDSVIPLLELSFSPEGDNSYTYTGSIPYFKTGGVDGQVVYSEKGFYTFFDLRFTNRVYPFNIDWDFTNQTISIDSTGLLANIDYKDLLLDIILSIESFPVGTVSNNPDTVISGDLSFQFDIPNQKFNLSLPNLLVGQFYIFDNAPSLHIALHGNNDNVIIEQFDFISPVDSFTGHGFYSVLNNKGAFTIGNETESIDITFTPFEQYYTGIIDVKNLSLTPFGVEEQNLDGTIIGRGEDLNNFEFSGNFNITPEAGAASPWVLSSSILINKDKLSLSNVNFTKGPLVIDNASLLFDISENIYSIGTQLNLTFENSERDKKIITEAQVSASLGTYDSWFHAGQEIYTKYREGDISASLKIPYLIVDNEILTTDRNIEINKNPEAILLSGNMLNGNISLDNLTGTINIFGVDNLINASFSGIFDPTNVDLKATINRFNVFYLNAFFPSPVFKFLPDSYTYGDVRVIGNILEGDFHLFGDVSGYEIGMDVWWVTRQDIYLSHPTFHIWDNVITSASLPIITVDRETKEKRLHRGSLELSMQNSFMDYFTLDIYTEEENKVFVRVPITSSNIDIEFWTFGHFQFAINELGRIVMSGDLTLTDGQISFGLKPLPEWWSPSKQVINDFNFTIGNNVRFIFPLSSSPILSADLQSDTSFSLYSNMFTNQIDVSGQILIKSGQIYYFSKNFFITEGSILLNETNGRLNPNISLRARLRDFDSNNEKIDIYLVLNNSTLDNINPSFESSPQKSNSEIMAILGNAILPSDIGTGNINTVASLVTSSVDILSRLGLMNSQAGDLNESIKKALNLDMFTLNSQIIENFLIDSVTANSNSNTSALSRYLNNTSIYLGKNLSDDFFLQGIIHFASVDNNESSTFFASDLAINTELSLEWTNPLGTITFFTHPESLTVYDTVRNFGLSYSKRITF